MTDWNPKPITHIWRYIPLGFGGPNCGEARRMRSRGWEVGDPVHVSYGGHRWNLPCSVAIKDRSTP